MRSIPLVLVLAVSTACATIEAVPPDPGLGPENAAHVRTYVPSAHWGGMAIDLRVYAGERYLGSLERGEGVAAFIRPGRKTISVRPYFLGTPEDRSWEHELDLLAGESYYLRFSQRLGDVTVVPHVGVFMSGHSRLQRVTEAAYRSRK